MCSVRSAAPHASDIPNIHTSSSLAKGIIGYFYARCRMKVKLVADLVNNGRCQ